MKKLELWDMSGDEDEYAGASATLRDDGQITYTGRGLQAILSPYLDVDRKMDQVFNDLDGWSNGYIFLKLKEGE